MKNLVLLLGVFFFLWSCTEVDDGILNEDLIFTNSFQISIPSYNYLDDEGNQYSIRGDTSYRSSYPDTVNSLPVLKWDSMGIRIITAAIFTNHINVEGNQIVNTHDIIWQWHSGAAMGGEEGYVQYSDGMNVLDSGIDYVNLSDSLDEGHYYWAVWGWGESGLKVLYSSRELEFYVIK